VITAKKFLITALFSLIFTTRIMQDELFKKIVTVFKIFYSFKASYPVGAFLSPQEM